MSVDPELAPGLSARLQAASDLVEQAVEQNRAVYGITTGFGGMASVTVPGDLAAESQDNLLAFLASGTGPEIDREHVRAAMLLRANVLSRGCSGVRPEIVSRILRFLHADYLPVVRELGSIGASGDLIPLSAIARAITGKPGFVEITAPQGRIDSHTALAQLELGPLKLRPKEGLAVVNGTSFSAAIAANCCAAARRMLGLTVVVQGMTLQAIRVQEEPFAAFVHRQKPHPGQIWTAEVMRRIFAGAATDGRQQPTEVQDRYSLRCLPQYMGPLVEGIARVNTVVTTEMNSVSDNPLVDTEEQRFYQSGNFLGQYVGIAMDDLRRFLGLMAKHLDVQIATLVAPEFNNGLPASLRGNPDRSYNMGLKGLQITGNSIMPMLTYYGSPLVEHFPTHAEQFNQNINGLSWGAANMAWRSVGLYQHALAVAMLFAVQGLDLRARASLNHFDGRALLGEAAIPLYEAIHDVLECPMNDTRPFLFNDCDRWLERDVSSLAAAIRCDDRLIDSVAMFLDSFDERFP